jgi:hypothetical protein
VKVSATVELVLRVARVVTEGLVLRYSLGVGGVDCIIKQDLMQACEFLADLEQHQGVDQLSWPSVAWGRATLSGANRSGPLFVGQEGTVV